MNDLFVWVPTKGWKLVRKFKRLDDAIEAAKEFLPLEVKVTAKTGRSYYGGRLQLTDYNTPEAPDIRADYSAEETEAERTINEHYSGVKNLIVQEV